MSSATPITHCTRHWLLLRENIVVVIGGGEMAPARTPVIAGHHGMVIARHTFGHTPLVAYGLFARCYASGGYHNTLILLECHNTLLRRCWRHCCYCHCLRHGITDMLRDVIIEEVRQRWFYVIAEQMLLARFTHWSRRLRAVGPHCYRSGDTLIGCRLLFGTRLILRYCWFKNTP